MLIYRNEFCPISSYPSYPPYADGAYLEDYFLTRFFAEGEQDNYERKALPIIWTTIYNEKGIRLDDLDRLQQVLKNVDQTQKYFTVAQHDDAPRHHLPPNTKVFSAGGRVKGDHIVPVPLICSPIPKNYIPSTQKNILASFVGSETHELRKKTIEHFWDKPDAEVGSKTWDINVPEEQFKYFIETTSRSEFCLAPRGYGPTSFRMYEAMQMNSIPVYISDDHYLPWEDELDWRKFCVIVNPDEISSLYDRLKSMSQETKNNMREEMNKVYRSHFTLDAVYKNILKRLD